MTEIKTKWVMPYTQGGPAPSGPAQGAETGGGTPTDPSAFMTPVQGNTGNTTHTGAPTK